MSVKIFGIIKSSVVHSAHVFLVMNTLHGTAAKRIQVGTGGVFHMFVIRLALWRLDDMTFEHDGAPVEYECTTLGYDVMTFDLTV